MTITAFSGLTAPSLVDLDANFADLDSRCPANSGGSAVSYPTKSLTIGKSGPSTSIPGVDISKIGSTSGRIDIVHSVAGGIAVQAYYYVGAVVGSISCTSTATAYNTTSDHRLKLNQSPLTGSGAFIDALKPKTWTWATDGSAGAGFIAHEFQEVSPSSVTGTKDAVDENGAPVYQSMQAGSAEVIANLVAEIQDLRRRLAAAGL